MCVHPGFCTMKIFENHCFCPSKTVGRQRAFSNSELNTAQLGFNGLSVCMFSKLKNNMPLFLAKKERESMVTAVNKYEDDGEVNFEAVNANLSHKLFDAVFRGKVFHFLSTCWFLAVQDDHISERRLRHALC